MISSLLSVHRLGWRVALRRTTLTLGCAAVCALPARGGEIVAWGLGDFGSLDVPLGSDYVALAAGGYSAYALNTQGAIVAWGPDGYGQVSNTPSGIGYRAIAAGLYTGYALAEDGSVEAWGRDNVGQISGAPSEAGFVALAAVGFTAFAQRADGSIVGWGNDAQGLVSGAPTSSGYLAVEAGIGNGFALAPDGSIQVWGIPNFGLISNAPTEVGFTSVVCDRSTAFASRADGSIVAWGGSDSFGLLSNTPQGTGFLDVASGESFACALQPDGSIVAWGRDEFNLVSSAPSGTGFTELVATQHTGYALRSASAPSFCDGADGSLAACPCANPGAPTSGCDLSQGTGGVTLDLTVQSIAPLNRVTWSGSGFPSMGAPASIVLRASTIDPATPIAFGDGLRCVGTPLVRLSATQASAGSVTHVHGHNAAVGSGLFHYQLWFRNAPATYCAPDAFNFSNGRTLLW